MNETPSTARIRVTFGPISMMADPVMTVPIFSLSYVDSIMSDSGELDAQKLNSRRRLVQAEQEKRALWHKIHAEK